MIKDIMAKSTRLGMQTFDQALFQLYEDGAISYEEAMRNADSKNEHPPQDQAAEQARGSRGRGSMQTACSSRTSKKKKAASSLARSSLLRLRPS